jgi:hypothetical protein
LEKEDTRERDWNQAAIQFPRLSVAIWGSVSDRSSLSILGCRGSGSSNKTSLAAGKAKSAAVATHVGNIDAIRMPSLQ